MGSALKYPSPSVFHPKLCITGIFFIIPFLITNQRFDLSLFLAISSIVLAMLSLWVLPFFKKRLMLLLFLVFSAYGCSLFL